jgi:phosphoribosylamine--glycine ligase
MSERILIVDDYTRAHALAWKIARDRPGCELFVAPGNAGLEPLATLVPISPKDIHGIVDRCRELRPRLVVIGPLRPLREGIVDALSSIGIRALGPTALGAMIESSKAWAAQLALEAGVPMPATYAFQTADAADDFVEERGRPFVVKPDGEALAAGVSVSESVEATHAAIDRVARKLWYGPGGRSIILQERVSGREVQVAALTDGVTHRVIHAVRGYKRAKDGDLGPLTSGMGSHAPVDDLTPEVGAEIGARILAPLLAGLRRRGIRFRGFIEAGVMLTARGPVVLEFNCRLGNPSANVILPLLRFDLVEATEAVFTGRLESFEHLEPAGAAVCVVLRPGAPGDPRTPSVVIEGLESASEGSLVFHQRTARQDGRWLIPPNGALGITGLGATVSEAREHAYAAVRRIHFEGAEWRSDIAAEAGWVG